MEAVFTAGLLTLTLYGLQIFSCPVLPTISSTSFQQSRTPRQHVRSQLNQLCRPTTTAATATTITMSPVTRRTWLTARDASGRKYGESADPQYEAYLSSKRESMGRMKAGKKLALGRLEGQERQQDRSLSSDISDDRDSITMSNLGGDESNPAIEERDAHNDIREGSSSSPITVMEHTSALRIDSAIVIAIFAAIEKRRWDEFLELISPFPDAGSHPCPKNLKTATKGNLMLHEAARNCPPVSAIKFLLTQNKDAARSKGGKGYLPVHYACATGASVEVVETLLDAYPASIRTRDTNDLMIPLHFACKWGASSDVIDLLVRTHPEGKQVRDIYAKTPADYASELGDDRSSILASLGRSASDVSSINLNEETADSKKHLEHELNASKAKIEKLSTELNERERKFALLYGAEKEKVLELEQQKEQLENECLQSKILQDEQMKKMELLEQEYKTLKELHATHNEKKTMLEEKINTLEKERKEAQEAINKLQADSSSKIKEDLSAAMMEHEAKYKRMLEKEQERVQDLERQAKEAELTHRHYTMALLQEHEKEVSRFEELTARFKVLEGQLRREIEHERTKRIAAETELSSGRGTDYQQALRDEQEKVSFLEDHISKVNDLLEAEQKRFAELEGILKDTLSLENEQREEIEAEYKEKENQYIVRIESETVKRQHLQEAYNDIAARLKTEIEKSIELQMYETELRNELEVDHKRIEELLKFEEESRSIIKHEQEKAQKAIDAEAEIRALLIVEKAKVEELEASHDKMYKLLELERANATQLREELNDLQVVYEKEMKKVRDAQIAESSARSELRSLHNKVSSMEGEEVSIKSKVDVETSKLEAAQQECELLKSMLETEQERVYTLTRSQEELRDLLDEEKQKVKDLEKQQIINEVQVEDMKNNGSTDTASMETQLFEAQRDLVEQRKNVVRLENEYKVMSRRLQSERTSIEQLEKAVHERDELLKVQQLKYDIIVKEQAVTESNLEIAQKKIADKQSEIDRLESFIQVEKDAVKRMQRQVEEAKTTLESKLEQVSLLEADENTSRQTLEACMKELELSNDEIRKLTDSLKIEKQRSQESYASRDALEQQLKSAHARATELENLLEDRKHKSIADQSTIQQLEERLVQLGEPIVLDNMELKFHSKMEHKSRQSILFESEKNKVRALEQTCEQIMSLLEWEKKHVSSLKDRQQELEDEVEDKSEEIAALKKELEATQRTVDELQLELVTFEGMKKEIIRLTAAGQQKDILLAAMVEAIGGARVIKSKAPVQRAEHYVNDLERIIGLDLAGLDMSVQGRSLVAYDDSSARRKLLTRVVLPLIPIGGLIAYHQHDPTLLRNLSANIGEYSSHFRDDMVVTLGALSDLSSELTSTVSAQVSDLASRIDTESLREPVTHAFAMATRRMNIRR